MDGNCRCFAGSLELWLDLLRNRIHYRKYTEVTALGKDSVTSVTNI